MGRDNCLLQRVVLTFMLQLVGVGASLCLLCWLCVRLLCHAQPGSCHALRSAAHVHNWHLLLYVASIVCMCVPTMY